jgi:hypothetical protein
MTTKPAGAGVNAYLGGIENQEQRHDCDQLVEMMWRVTACEPPMRGPSIVGFDSYRYRHASGREDDMPVTGFSSPKPDIGVCLLREPTVRETSLAMPGRHKVGESCLCIRRLPDVDLDVLEQLIVESVADCKPRNWKDLDDLRQSAAKNATTEISK